MANNPPISLKRDIESIKKVTSEIIREYGLKTPCLYCRNFSRCAFIGSIAFIVGGQYCTRNCRFCIIKHHKKPLKPDREEPERIAAAVRALGLRHVVLSSVSRDDLEDMGAGHLARCIMAVKLWNRGTFVEAFIPNYGGRRDLIKKIVDAKPDIIGHGIETVKRLQHIVRDGQNRYYESLQTIKAIRELSKEMIIKSSLMLGFREEKTEVLATLRHLRKAGVDMITIGQYLRPTKNNLRVLEYVPRDVFEFYEREAYQLGYKYVLAKPTATYSYLSDRMLALLNRL